MQDKRLIVLFLVSLVWAGGVRAQSGSGDLMHLSPGLDTLVGRVLTRFPSDGGGSVAVVPFLKLDGSTTQLGLFVSERLTTGVIDRGIRVIERNRLDAAIRELDLNKGAAFDQAEVKKLGQLVGADFILTGSISELETFVEINARLFNAATGASAGAGKVQLFKDQDVLVLLGKPSAATGSDRGKSSGDRSSPSDGTILQSDSREGATIDLLSCRLEGSRVRCDAFVTLTAAGWVSVLWSTSIVDPQGTEVKVSRLRLGVEEGGGRVKAKLIAGTRTKLELVFDGAPEDMTQLEALKIATTRGDFVFRRIKLSG